MTQIKEKQEARERGEWESLEAPQRQEQEALFRQLGMLARYLLKCCLFMGASCVFMKC